MLAGHDRCASSGSASRCFAGAAFVYAKNDFLTVDNLHEANIGPLRKMFVVLDLWSQFVDWGDADIVDLYDAVGVAEGNDTDCQVFVSDTD